MLNERYVVLEATVTPTTETYHADDCVGGLVTFNLASAGGAVQGGVLSSLTLVDDDNEGAALNLWFFDAQPSAIANHGALALSAADLKKVTYFRQVLTGDYVTVNSLKVAYYSLVGTQVRCDAAGKLYLYVQCTGTPTYASGKTLYIRLGLLTAG